MQRREFRYQVGCQGSVKHFSEIFKMLVKKGVCVGGIRAEILFSMMIANQIFEDAGELLVITSVTEEVHGKLSYHPAGFAFDCRLPVHNGDIVANRLRKELGIEFDILIETAHIHIEFEVRNKGALS